MIPAFLALFLFGQTPSTSTIVVVVSDQSGAAVPGATVTVTNEQTGDTREFTSGPDGTASFPALSLTGTYRVAVAKQGFGPEEQKGVALQRDSGAREHRSAPDVSAAGEIHVLTRG